MKALTICQPFAHLICLPDDDDRAKRIENRTWETMYRGPILIHAGKSKAWLEDDNFGIPLDEMVFGAIVGVANLADCFHVQHSYEAACRRRPWIAGHKWVGGPFCFVLSEVRRFETPIPYRGAQGFFDVPKDVVSEALQAVFAK